MRFGEVNVSLMCRALQSARQKREQLCCGPWDYSKKIREKTEETLWWTGLPEPGLSCLGLGSGRLGAVAALPSLLPAEMESHRSREQAIQLLFPPLGCRN
jgi:hypothetical protein